MPTPHAAVQQLRIADLRFGLSPRFLTVDLAHVAALKDTIDSLPPILVLRQSMLVVDGIHRTTAAMELGRDVIPAVWFDGDEGDAFASAVRANISHGKPLSRQERNAAAQRLINEQPSWSDRRLADTCGLSAAAVASVRRSIATAEQLNGRVGRDGRIRPTNPVALRQQIAAALKTNIDRPLREVANEIHCSPATVLDVRRRLERGHDPVPDGLHDRQRPQSWSTDRALASAASSSALAAWLDRTAVCDDDWAEFLDAVPVSRVYEIVDEISLRIDSLKRLTSALNNKTSR